ncbi:MAG: hypothetical protein A2Z24_02525 [Candidatus Woykebacteria bacterium RBG_16_44_10]|uniref:Uncharacterized protein n=1 Tax=Candidatus Woykebacteria bacterium RBG_16_44_10 TaxID=1802597 RepID=A0A1G1WES1_9BACT|nr:MAG: hypothetical protein A2Z24_02525 [Candidatus Woykebacteria bacterium RBG_16_44_10]
MKKKKPQKTLIIVLLVASILISIVALILFQSFFVPKSFSITWIKEGQAWGYMNEEVLISSNGNILVTDKVDGKQNKGKLSVSDMDSLKKGVRDVNFYSLEEIYYIPCEDCPKNFITVTEKSKSKTVQILPDEYIEDRENVPLVPKSLNQLLVKLEDYYARKVEW